MRAVLVPSLQYAAADLILLHAHEQRAEVALSEAIIPLALDDLEENGADERAREDLQQIASVCAVDQDAALPELLDRLAVPGQPLLEHLVIRIRRWRHEREATCVQRVPGGEDIRGMQRDVLNALAMILLDELLDLIDLTAALFGLRLIDRDADLAARRRKGTAREPGVLPFDVEVLLLAEIEDPAVEVVEIIHPTLAHVVREMVDRLEARTDGVGFDSRLHHEVDVVDRRALVAVHQVDEAAADALDGRNVELHRTEIG